MNFPPPRRPTTKYRKLISKVCPLQKKGHRRRHRLSCRTKRAKKEWEAEKSLLTRFSGLFPKCNFGKSQRALGWRREVENSGKTGRKELEVIRLRWSDPFGVFFPPLPRHPSKQNGPPTLTNIDFAINAKMR